MDVVDAVVILGVAGIAASSLYFYVTFTSKVQKEMQEYQQQNITLRAQGKPRDWWQEVLVEAAKHPEWFEKLSPLISSGQLQQLLMDKLKSR